LAAIAFLAFIALAPATYAQSSDKLNPGDNLPGKETMLKNANGAPVSLMGAAKANGLLVMFSCNTCPFVIKNQPITKKVMDYANAHKIGMVIINSNEAQRGDDDSYEAMVKYAKAQQYTVPYLVDESSRLADMFGAGHTPEVFLFSNEGKLVYKGAMNDNPSDPAGYKKMYVEDAISAMIAGKDVNPKTTKSIGCGIKRKA
jgi:redoxin